MWFYIVFIPWIRNIFSKSLSLFSMKCSSMFSSLNVIILDEFKDSWETLLRVALLMLKFLLLTHLIKSTIQESDSLDLWECLGLLFVFGIKRFYSSDFVWLNSARTIWTIGQSNDNSVFHSFFWIVVGSPSSVFIISRIFFRSFIGIHHHSTSMLSIYCFNLICSKSITFLFACNNSSTEISSFFASSVCFLARAFSMIQSLRFFFSSPRPFVIVATLEL